MNTEDTKSALQKAFARDTCWPGCVEEWTPENPAWGHCVMCALYINEFYGGELMFTEALLPGGVVVPHYFNRVDGEGLDLASSQFGEEVTFQNRRMVSREYVLSLPDNEEGRYKIFRQRVLQHLFEK